MPVADVRELYSPVTEPRPFSTVSKPPVMRRLRTTSRAPPMRIMHSWTTSVVMEAFSPEKRE